MRHSNGARVVEKAKDLYEDARERAAEGFDEANSFIHRKPVASTLIGVGIGFLLASLFRSRD